MEEIEDKELKAQSNKQIKDSVPNHQNPISQQQSIEDIVDALSPQLQKSLLEKYTTLSQTYSRKIKQALHELEDVRREFGGNLLTVQKNFVGIIIRPDDKAGKILGFQENYNKLQSEQLSIVRDS